jgi:CheY-like chemotaxis protein
MTGWGASGDRERCLSNGFQAHIVKPASIEEIESVLTRLLEGSASQPLAASSLC